jgi:hypothetical protein
MDRIETRKFSLMQKLDLRKTKRFAIGTVVFAPCTYN